MSSQDSNPLSPDPDKENGSSRGQHAPTADSLSMNSQSSYFSKIVKHVPAPIIAAYVAATGVIEEIPDNPIWLYWAIFGCLMTLTPLYVVYLPDESDKNANSLRYNILAAMLAFGTWVFAIGEPFASTFDWYRPVYGSLLLIIVTLTLPVLERIAAQLHFFK